MGDYINGPAFEFNTNDPILSENNKVNPDQAIKGSGGTVSDATTTSKGKIQLSGDLGGTADNPTVPGLNDKIDKSGRTAGIHTFIADGSSFIYTFLHTYTVSPLVILVTRNQTTDFENFMTTWDNTIVTITYENPPSAGTINLNWLAIL